MTNAASPTSADTKRPAPSSQLPADAARSQKLLELLRQKFSGTMKEAYLDLGDAVVEISRERFRDFVNLLKLDRDLSFNFLVSVTAVDWLDQREMRYEVIYHFLSLSHLYRLRVKVPVPEEDPSIESLVSLYGGANFMEREAWDLLGVKFRGHPDLRKILMYEEFIGHPLRKDYPLQGKQPRVALIAPEVSNTARDMNRQELYAIKKRPDTSRAA